MCLVQIVVFSKRKPRHSNSVVVLFLDLYG